VRECHATAGWALAPKSASALEVVERACPLVDRLRPVAADKFDARPWALFALCIYGLVMAFAPAGAAPAQPDGAALFELSCSSCHTAGKGEPNKFGPNLFGVVGRASGSVPDFQYSTALSGGKIKWTEQKLDQFIKDPAQTAPDTSMPFGGLPQEAYRAQIISFLKGARSEDRR
jgi:cytochrome c